MPFTKNYDAVSASLLSLCLHYAEAGANEGGRRDTALEMLGNGSVQAATTAHMTTGNMRHSPF